MSLFNGSTVEEHNDYRLFVIGHLPTLLYLDDTCVTQAERTQARSYRYLCGLAGAISFFERLGHQSKTRTVENVHLSPKIEIIHFASD